MISCWAFVGAGAEVLAGLVCAKVDDTPMTKIQRLRIVVFMLVVINVRNSRAMVYRQTRNDLGLVPVIFLKKLLK